MKQQTPRPELGRLTLWPPGAIAPLEYDRGPAGELTRISAGGRTYYEKLADGNTRYDGDFAGFEQIELPGGLLRRWHACGRRWTEKFGWDLKGQLTDVDGVAIRYDQQGRIVSCLGPGGRWTYGYSGPHLTVIDTPGGLRHVLRGPDGRAEAYREGARTIGIRYDAQGRRLPLRRDDPRWAFDELGRLWTIAGADGRVTLTYLWDGWQCLGAIAGEPGEPMSAVYCLDPTGTPVRVIGRDSIRALPRDAFGELLLRERSVPGLYGGAGIDGLVHLPFRRLDPLTGSFDAPDPFNGEQQDPRRAAGWKGPLSIELPASGPYTVCRNNPVSLSDPTGAASELWWLIPSALTWSMQNTVGSLLGMWLNLEFSPLGWLFSAFAGSNPFDVEWITAKNFSSFALRADGWISRIQPVAWTYQFLLNEEGASFTAVEDARLFAPDTAFQPRLYGSVLLCAPSSAGAFLIRGQRNPPNNAGVTDWSRCGGTAQAVIPNSQVPVFPAGGFHFGTTARGVKVQRGELIELEPGAALLTGTLSSRIFLDAPQTGLNLQANQSVLLTDGANVVEIARVLSADEADSKTRITVDTAGTRLQPTGIKLDGLTAPAGTEQLRPVAGSNNLLGVAGSSRDYQPGTSALILSRAGSVVHFAVVSALEAKLSLDAPLPATLGNTLHVRPATATGNFNAKIISASVFRVVSGAVPGQGTGVVVGPIATGLACVVQSVSAKDVTVDRDLGPVGAPNTNTQWRPVAAGAEIGRRLSAAELDPKLTYTPDLPGTAPSANFVQVDGTGSAVRRITALDHDAIVLAQPRPDALADPYDVQRFRTTTPSIAGLTQSQSQILALNQPAPGSARAFHAVQVAGATIVAGATPLIAGAAFASGAATGTIATASAPAGIVPGQLVAVTPAGGTAQPAAIQRIRLTVTLDRNFPTLGDRNLEAALVRIDSPAYDAERRADRVVRVRPRVGGGATSVDMPRFVPGELVIVQFTVAGTAGEVLGTVATVAGTTITLAADSNAVPAAATGITLAKLLVTDPATGTSRLGFDGNKIANNQVQFTVWAANDFAGQQRIAIVDGTTVFATRIATGNQPIVVEFVGAPAFATPVDIASFATTASGFSNQFTIDGATLTLLDTPLGTIGTGLVIVVPYIDSGRRVAGEFHSGNVRVPKDHENASIENNRREALQDHELTHTLQSAQWGPIFIFAFPVWGLEIAADLTHASGPEYSPYSPGSLAADKLTINASGGTTFSANDNVQVAQSGRAATVTLGTSGANGFQLIGRDLQALQSAGLRDGPVQVRKWASGTGRTVLRRFIDVIQFLSAGGLLNVLSLAGWGGVAALILYIIQGIRRLRRDTLHATVNRDQKSLTIEANAHLDGLAPGRQCTIESGDQIFIRSVDSLLAQSIVLHEQVPLTGDVAVGVYSPLAPLFSDLRSYFPAKVPDPNRPARLELQAVDGSSPSFSVNDRVDVRAASGTSYRTYVTAVDGLNIELDDQPHLPEGAANEFLVGHIGSNDPVGTADAFLMNGANVGWLRFLHDPWGQLFYALQPPSGNLAAQIATRAGRYLFGTQSWACLFLGVFWIDDAFKGKASGPPPAFNFNTYVSLNFGGPHESYMEQEASHASGDTYSPIGTLHGDVAFVGDIARYWLTVTGGTRDGTQTAPNTPADLIILSQQDAPGVNLVQAPNLLFPGGETFAVPSDLYVVNNAGALTAARDRTWIPAAARLERSAGIYVAYSRPPAAGSNYPILTMQAGNSVTLQDVAKAFDAQRVGQSTIFFQKTPQDVTATLATLPVAENAVFDLIPFQRARFLATPNGSRVYRLTLSEPGSLFDVENDDVVSRRGAPAAPASPQDFAEISRFHGFNTATGAFDSGIGPLHLPADLHIGVRRFEVRVVETVPLRATIAQTDPPLASVRPGDVPDKKEFKPEDENGFLLVPAQIAPGTAPTINAAGLLLGVTVDPTAGADADFIRDGAAFSVKFPFDKPPEATVSVEIKIRVGPTAAGAVELTCKVDVNPHFTLDVAGGGAPTVARGQSITLTASDGTAIESNANPVAGVEVATTGADVTVKALQAAPPQFLTLLVNEKGKPRRIVRRTITIT